MYTFTEFAKMGGYGAYVWPSYALVFALLAMPLLKPWRRWLKIKKKAHDE